jgi:release factor glutamine methyltransferase
VFRPRSDSWLLARILADLVTPEAHVLDVCTGSGLVAVSAALAGARRVVAVDVCPRAVLAARVNAWWNGTRIDARRGDLFGPVGGARFDLIASNPPYLPGVAPPDRGTARAWEGGHDGRAILDRLIDEAPGHLRPGGALLVIHSSVCGLERTERRMVAAGLQPEILVRRRGPLGPLLSARAPELEALGLLRPGEREEDIAIFRGCLAA